MPQTIEDRKALQDERLADLMDSTRKDDEETARLHQQVEEKAKLAGTGFVLLGVAVGPLIFAGMVILGVLVVWAVRSLAH